MACRPPSTLVEICLERLARNLVCFQPWSGHLTDIPLADRLSEIAEPELAHQLWTCIDRFTRAGQPMEPWPAVLQRRLALLAALGGAFWRLPALRIADYSEGQGARDRLPGVLASSVRLVAGSLSHLELCTPQLGDLDWAAGLPLLTCLSLRGCTDLGASALWALRACPRLAALDLSGLCRLGDDAGAPLAAHGALRALHLGETRVGDALVAALTFRVRLDAWSCETGMALSEEQRCWPVCRVEDLVLTGTRVTAAALPLLHQLGGLRFLDVRW
ncbi:hypothetical protein WJX81_002113 [Elliptochloris bilobata]|uniref:Uncharacterized protein n=1 Tax=Elliptochloris bilobata TaxID=381761 RepID=A0AAW1QXZ7_9CHLO